MMKVIGLFMLVFVASASAQCGTNGGTEFHCVKEGESCAGLPMAEGGCTGPVCTMCEYSDSNEYENVLCPVGSTCPTQYIGLPCSGIGSYGCTGRMSPDYLTCQNDVCSPDFTGGYAWAGDSCRGTNSQICMTDLICISEICEEGANCTTENQCLGTRFCSDGVCRAPDALSQPCTITGTGPYDTSCDWGSNLSCGPANTCIELESLNFGASCRASFQCSGDLICIQSPSDGPVCGDYIAGGESCTDNAECAFGTFCDTSCSINACTANGISHEALCLGPTKKLLFLA
eukprot:TRINITY_DN20058_c0_g1_i1.p1 TRINITY_DN20058_c0_g1~~TRINITY_DN20058_c0_g1_i1.p1  ORF type:complete len:288 (+),score=21.71 TRINITY_DN20058_c0_g1_i1:24-887(+)